jgi:hypothetical protein
MTPTRRDATKQLKALNRRRRNAQERQQRQQRQAQRDIEALRHALDDLPYLVDIDIIMNLI